MSLTKEDRATLRRHFVSLGPSVESAGSTTYAHAEKSDVSFEVLEIQDCPKPGFATYATVGLAERSWTHRNFPHRLELVAATMPRTKNFEKALVAAETFITDNDFFVGPGTVIRDLMKNAPLPEIADRMPHGLIVNPFLWGRAIANVDVSVGRVWPLQLVPIYENERRFIEENGFETFEELLEGKAVPLARLERVSSVTRK